MPRRRLGRLGSVVPASPTNKSSEALVSLHRASDDWRFGIASVRMPISSPLVFTSAGTFSTAAPVLGSTVVVVPCTSFERNPSTYLRKDFVFADDSRGTTTTVDPSPDPE